MPEQSILDRAAEYAYAELERLGGDPAKLDVPLRTVVILYSIQAIIDNGGLIGAMEDADRLDKAAAMFPFENPHLYQEKRLKFMESLAEDHEFFELGNGVCGDEKVWSALEEYVRKNAGTFRVM